jgi:hypothetical protein
MSVSPRTKTRSADDGEAVATTPSATRIIKIVL